MAGLGEGISRRSKRALLRNVGVQWRPFFNDVGRRRPKRLAEKLLHMRKALGMSQSQMAGGLTVVSTLNHVSKFERNKSEPTLEELLAYAQIARVALDHIIDDLELMVHL